MDPKRQDREEGEGRRVPAWMLVLLALVLGNGIAYFAYVRRKQSPRSNGQHAAVPEIPETRVSFDSQPPGANVLEGGAVIGVTPFARNFSRVSPDMEREFTFELAGHNPVKVRARLDQDRILLQTTLVPAGNPEESRVEVIREPAPEPEEPPRGNGRSAAQRGREIVARARAAERAREAAAAAAQPAAAVTKVEDEAAVPKLADERGVPKLEDDRGGVPKLADERGVPKLGDEGGVPKLKDEGGVPKLKDESGGVPKLQDEGGVPKVEDRRRRRSNVPKLEDEKKSVPKLD